LDFIKYISTKLGLRSRAANLNEKALKSDEIYIISSSGWKIWDDEPNFAIECPARDAYTHRSFKKWLKDPRSASGLWLILSPKYGFLEPDTLIRDYKVAFKDSRIDPITDVQLRAQVLNEERFGVPLKKWNFVHVVWKNNLIQEKVMMAFEGHSAVDWIEVAE
jgi:hypothetical protein